MTDVYEACPAFEDAHYLLRLVQEDDADDLLAVYSDKAALPFFNSDNCGGDNFYYPTKERMCEAIRFWHSSYETKWLVRFSVIDKRIAKAIGTIELFHRKSEQLLIGTHDGYAYNGYWTLQTSNSERTEDNYVQANQAGS